MRYGGSIYLFGYFRTLSKLVSPLQSIGYQLRQQIVIDKGLRAVSGRATKDYKIFPNVTESCLLLIKDPYLYVKQILLDAKKANKFSSKEINEKIGVKSNGGGMWSIYTGENICRQIPTKEIWDKFSDVFQLKIDYCKISQIFNPIKGLTDVWTDINFYEEDRIHPTQKPLKLIKRLIQTSSNEGDLIVDPFLGSSSSVIASIDMGREIHGCEKNKEYFDKSVERIEKVIQARK
jgi:DNA modification methylase